MSPAGPGPEAAVASARRVEELGYSTLWLPETMGRDPFAPIAQLAGAAPRLRFATGIANIHRRHPGAMVQAADTVGEQTAGRFTLGLGVSHAEQIDACDPGFVDALVAWGDPAAIVDRVREHLDAGADLVCIQPMTPGSALRPDEAALAAIATEAAVTEEDRPWP